MKYKIYPYKIILSSNKGSAIVIAMLTLLIVTIIGLSTIDNSITEKNIATNDVLYKKSFAAADGGTEVAMQLIEESLRCGGELYTGDYETDPYYSSSPKDFLFLKPGVSSGKPNTTDEASDNTTLAVLDSDFAMDWQEPQKTTEDGKKKIDNKNGPDDNSRDIAFVETAPLSDLEDSSKGDDVPHTNIAVVEKPLKGRVGYSILMAEGYSGSGKGAGGNVIKPYDIHSRHEYRARNSCSHIVIEYNTDGKCDSGINCDCTYKN